jgi:hypothetical protein
MFTQKSKKHAHTLLPVTLLILASMSCSFITPVNVATYIPTSGAPMVFTPLPNATSAPIEVTFTVTVPYWTSGDVYVGIGDQPAFLKLEAYNDVIYIGEATLPVGTSYYYSQGNSQTAETGIERQITSGRISDAVIDWQNDEHSSLRPDFQKSFFVAACHTCGVSITKGNFIEPIGRSMDEIKKDGGNWVSFMPNWFIVPDYQGNEIVPIYSDEFKGTSGWVTSTIRDEDLVTLIGMAHDRDLKVYVCPALAPENWGPGVKGKGDLEPSDPDAFFKSYKAFIGHYADIAEQTGVEMLCVGSENDTLTEEDLSQNSGINKTARWRDVIASARQHYSGLLTYSVSCITEDRCGPQLIKFWDDLDVIGWEWYVPIATGEHESIASMRQNAERIIQNNIKPLYVHYQKPIVITEMGWEAYPGACAHTYGTGTSQGGDRLEQASCYEAAFQAIDHADFIQGVHIFTWTANLEGHEFPWVWTDKANEVRFSITEDMIAKWYHYLKTP